MFRHKSVFYNVLVLHKIVRSLCDSLTRFFKKLHTRQSDIFPVFPPKFPFEPAQMSVSSSFFIIIILYSLYKKNCDSLPRKQLETQSWRGKPSTRTSFTTQVLLLRQNIRRIRAEINRIQKLSDLVKTGLTEEQRIKT